MKFRHDAKGAQATFINDAGELNVNRDGTAASWHRAFILQAARDTVLSFMESYSALSYREMQFCLQLLSSHAVPFDWHQTPSSLCAPPSGSSAELTGDMA